MNILTKERSAYLKHAASQKIHWLPWSEKAFEKAKQNDRPVFLSSGAVWCHWCHVMAKECFYDDEIAEILNNHFVPVKLDRDERPDIDRRYQMAVAAMGQGGGWPLSIFLTPDKVPFFGGTYFPPEDRSGRPGFKKVLNAVLELYRSKKDEISRYTDRLMSALTYSPASRGNISESHIDEALERILAAYDQENGGFGTAPKFPMPGAIDFLLNRYYLTGDESLGSALRKTLESMACGGFYDQVGGGFHRYATDKSWIIPHFEKMADDNAWLLRNYLCAYSVTGHTLYREIAEGIVYFIRNVLSGSEGGFYASQDADVSPDDEGGYFTWTDQQFRRTLDNDEYRVLSLYLMHDAGSMHHDASKKTLFVVKDAEEIAEETGKGVAEVIKIIQTGKAKLLQERNKRETPFIDTTLYTSVNGMLVSVFLLGYRVLRDRGLKDFAIISLDRIIKERFIDNTLYHTENVHAFLDDYACLIDALIAAYEATGSTAYSEQADELMKICLDRLWDRDQGGFFDTDDHLLGIGIKGVEDMPHPSANSLCIRLLLKLSSIAGNDIYRRHAEEALKVFSEKAVESGIHAGYYFSVLDSYYNPLTLTLHTKPQSTLSEAALSLYSPHCDILYGEDRGYVVPCIGDACHEPVDNHQGMKYFMNRRNRISHHAND